MFCLLLWLITGHVHVVPLDVRAGITALEVDQVDHGLGLEYELTFLSFFSLCVVYCTYFTSTGRSRQSRHYLTTGKVKLSPADAIHLMEIDAMF